MSRYSVEDDTFNALCDACESSFQKSMQWRRLHHPVQHLKVVKCDDLSYGVYNMREEKFIYKAQVKKIR